MPAATEKKRRKGESQDDDEQQPASPMQLNDDEQAQKREVRLPCLYMLVSDRFVTAHGGLTFSVIMGLHQIDGGSNGHS